jgi:hypothetical protein
VRIFPDIKSKSVHNINESSNLIVSAEIDRIEAEFGTLESQQFCLETVDAFMGDGSYKGLVEKMRS